jgi:hypothetical protein
MKIKKYILLFLSIQLFVINIFCQQIPERKWNIGVDAGYTNFTLSDNSINYYTYQGNSFQNVNLQLYYFSDSDLIFGNIFYGKSRLMPEVDLSKKISLYNYLDFMDISISLEYFHKVLTLSNGINIFLGAAYSPQLTDKVENYNNSPLWKYAQGYKECGEITYANFSINALLCYRFKNYFVLCKSGFSLLNFSGRANDSFTGFYYKFYSINNYTNYYLSLACYRSFSDRFDLKFECSAQYEDYKYSSDFRILKKIASLGVSYKF